jgi:hypothetical protein
MRAISQRLTGAVLVAALHVPVVLGLLVVNLAPGVREQLTGTPPETMVALPPLPLPQTSTAPTRGELRNGAATVPSDLKLPFATTAPSAAAPALGLPLFACAPENLRNLSRQEQEKCLKLSGGRYVAMKDGLPKYVKLPGPEWEGLRNSDIRARERNTADPCAIAKMSKMAGAECYHEVIYGKGLW